jgi:hypothetical protein
VSGPARAQAQTEAWMSQDLQEAIRVRAYTIWESEGRPDGRSLEHWLQAEDEAVSAGLYGVLEDGKAVAPPKGAKRRQPGPAG